MKWLNGGSSLGARGSGCRAQGSGLGLGHAATPASARHHRHTPPAARRWPLTAGLVTVALLILVHAMQPVWAQVRTRRQGVPSHYRLLKTKEEGKYDLRADLRNGLRIVIEERAGQPLVAVTSYAAHQALTQPDEMERARKLAQWLDHQIDFVPHTHRLGGLAHIVADLHGTAFTTLIPAQNFEDALVLHRGLLTLEPPSDLAGKNSPPDPSEPRPLKLQDSEARSLHASRFRVSNIILSISGSVFREDSLRLVAEQFGTLKGTGRAHPWVVAPLSDQPVGFRYEQQRQAAANARVRFAFAVPGLGHRDHHAATLLSRALAGGRAALLSRLLVDEGLALEVETEIVESPEGAHLQIEITPAEGRLDAAEVAVLGLLDVLRKRSIHAAPLRRSQALLAGEFYNRLLPLESRSWMRARQIARGVTELEKPVQRILKVEPAALERVLKKHLTMDRLSLVEFLPASFEPRTFTAETLRETFELLVPPESQRLEGLVAAFESSPQRELEALQWEPSYTPNQLKRTSILRGPEVFLLEEHSVPLVELGIIFPGGRLDEEESNRGITELMLRSWLRSGETGNLARLWDQVESAGGVVSLINEPDYFGFRITLLSREFSRILSLLNRWLRETTFQEAAVELEKKRLLAELAEDSLDPRADAMGSLRMELFPAHPYGWAGEGTDASVSSLDAEAIQGWYERQVSPYHPLLLVVGDVEGTSFLASLIPELSNSSLSAKRSPVREIEDEKDFAQVSRGEVSFVAVAGPALGTRDQWLTQIFESLMRLWEGRVPDVEGGRGRQRVELFQESNLHGGAVFAVSRQEAGELSSSLQELHRALIREDDFLRAVVLRISQFHHLRSHRPTYLVELGRSLVAGEKASFEEEYLVTIKGMRLQGMRDLIQRLFGVLPRPDEEAGRSPIER